MTLVIDIFNKIVPLLIFFNIDYYSTTPKLFNSLEGNFRSPLSKD